MKRTQTRKKHVFHLRRLGLLLFLCAALLITQLDTRGAFSAPSSPQVLAFAAEMGRSGLLAGTNDARANQSLPALSANSQLNNSAQAKAEDMATKDYWAHVAPDGTEPWFFFKQAGYPYVRAGENLAYGFASSQAAIEGWLNSPSHRANIMGDYTEVGFGIANAPNFQGEGPQTIVVAHYGARAAPVPAPTPAPAPATQTTKPPTPPVVPPVTQPTPAPAVEPVSPTPSTEPAEPAPTPEETEPAAAAPPATTQTVPSTPVTTAVGSRVSVLNMISQQNAPLAAIVSLIMVCIAAVGYALTHRSAFEHAIIAGETFAAKHPGIDMTIIAGITALILLASYGTVG